MIQAVLHAAAGGGNRKTWHNYFLTFRSEVIIMPEIRAQTAEYLEKFWLPLLILSAIMY